METTSPCFYAQVFEDVGELAHLVMKHLVGEDAAVARFAFPDQRGFVLRGVPRCLSRQLYETLVCPPTNQCANGSCQSSTF